MACPLCAWSDSILRTDPQLHLDWRHCLRCGYRFKDARRRPGARQEWEQYRLHQNHFGSRGYVRMNRNIIQNAVLPWAHEPPGKALDYGSGPGPVLGALLSRLGWQVGLYDPFFAPYFAYHAYQYQLITIVEVAEHLFQPRLVFQNLARLLHENGLLVVSTRMYPPRWAYFDRWVYRHDPTHVGLYQYKSMLWLAQSLELELVYHDFHQLTTFRKPSLGVM